MKIEIYDELKRAIKDAINEWYVENKNTFHNIHSIDNDGTNLLTIKQFCKKHAFITEGALRSKLNYRSWNKFNLCISKVGRRILIKEKEALDWFNNPPPEQNWTYDRKKYGEK